MRVAICGRFSVGGVKMRGAAVASHLGWDAIDVKRVGFLRPLRRYDAIVLVKHDLGKGPRLRRACDRLLYDPLDAWQSSEPDAEPLGWWRARLREVAPDDVIATSPSCVRVVTEAIEGAGAGASRSPRVRLLPHHADPRIAPGARRVDGPIVYAGDARYLGDAAERIATAAASIGRDFLVREGEDALDALSGASLSLCVRLPPHDTPLNRSCKPQVKLENAAAAGLPVLASDHPCVSSLRPETSRIGDPPPGGHSVEAWAAGLRAALASAPLADPVTLEAHARALRALVEGTSPA